MANDDLDQAEIDRLVDELAHPRKRVAVKPVVAAPAAAPGAGAAAFAAAAAAPQSPAANSVTRGRSWTTAQLHMPAVRTERRESPAASFASGFVSTFMIRLRTLAAAALQNALRKLKTTQWGTLSVRVFVGLGVLLSAAMPYWPYSHAWSWGLLLYLCAIELVVVTGIWGAKLTWDARLPAAHAVAVGTVIWGLGLIVWDVAPRLAYA